MLDLHFKNELNWIKHKIPSLKTIEEKSLSLLKIMTIFLTIAFIIIVIILIFEKDDNIIVQPFETNGIGNTIEGKPLATLLCFDLQKIKNIYEPEKEKLDVKGISRGNTIILRPLEGFRMPDLPLKNAPLGDSLSKIGTIGVEGTSISIGNLILSMKEFLGNKANTITCSIQRYNSSLFIIAILEEYYFSKGDVITFEDATNISNEEQIRFLISDLAFKIYLELNKRRANPNEYYQYPKKWETFKYVTQGRDAYNNYMKTEEIKYLDMSKDMAFRANSLETSYYGSFELLSCLGFAYLERDEDTEAANIFNKINRLMPFESAMGLGLVYGKNGNDSEALNAFDRAIKLNPKNPDAWINKGVILAKHNNYSEAINAFDCATTLEPEYATAWIYKGDALARLGDALVKLGKEDKSKYRESIQAYNRAIDLHSQYADVWYRGGVVLYKIGEYQRANRAFEKAIELNSSNAVYWHNKGMVLSSMEKYDQSIEAYDRAIEINPQYTDAWVKKATILYMQGNFEEALKAIDNINDLDPKNKIACKIKCNIFRRDSRRYNESIQECNCA